MVECSALPQGREFAPQSRQLLSVLSIMTDASFSDSHCYPYGKLQLFFFDIFTVFKVKKLNTISVSSRGDMYRTGRSTETQLRDLG